MNRFVYLTSLDGYQIGIRIDCIKSIYEDNSRPIEHGHCTRITMIDGDVYEVNESFTVVRTLIEMVRK